MTYKETMEYMYSRLPMFQRVGPKAYNKNTERTEALCKFFDNPELKLKTIHIAGTNGKGSVSHMLSAVLTEHGFKTGLYVSPHYKDFRERIKINGKYISKKFVCDFIHKSKDIVNEIQPSFFELTVVMALQYFSESNTDYAVIETGLGGRLDSTNVITPLISIITNISWDHMDVLGDSIAKISIEKAGIIKHKIPVVIGRRQEESEPVFKEEALKKNADLFFAEDIKAEFTDEKITLDGRVNFIPDLKGPYQLENYRTSYTACKILTERSIISLENKKIQTAFSNVASLSSMIGRWQWKVSDKKILLDSAHNEDGIKMLCDWIKIQNFRLVHVVIGFVKDKDLTHVLGLLPTQAIYYFTQANIPRALPVEDLYCEATKYQLIGKKYKRVSNALNAAKKKATLDDLIVVCGSIFVVAEVI